MTTFTLQDLTPEQLLTDHLNAPEVPKETKDALVGVLGSMYIGEGKSNVMDEVHALGQTIADNTRLEAQAGTLYAPEPQPTLTDIINTICTQLQLLATVISSSATKPVEDNVSSTESLQQCVSLTLQQADWFKTIVRHELIGAGIEDLAKEAVESVVEDEVESYFDNRFDPSDHFDFDDAVRDAVSDQIDDVVRDRVMDSLEEVVAEKLSEASIKVEFN